VEGVRGEAGAEAGAEDLAASAEDPLAAVARAGVGESCSEDMKIDRP
jgi:hypothetical protein